MTDRAYSEDPGMEPDEFSEDERRMIRRLQALARDWPPNLMLASMGGSLCLFRTDDRLRPGFGGGDELDPDKVLWSDGGHIPNTGGDW